MLPFPVPKKKAMRGEVVDMSQGPRHPRQVGGSARDPEEHHQSVEIRSEEPSESARQRAGEGAVRQNTWPAKQQRGKRRGRLFRKLELSLSRECAVTACEQGVGQGRAWEEVVGWAGVHPEGDGQLAAPGFQQQSRVSGCVD